MQGKYFYVFEENEKVPFQVNDQGGNECHILFRIPNHDLSSNPFLSHTPSLAGPSSSIARYTPSGGNSRAETPPAVTSRVRKINNDLVRDLAMHNIDVDLNLCANTDKPGLHLVYQRYIAANEINKQVSKMRQERSWKCKEVPSRTDVINLFVAKTTWHAFYAIRIPAAEQHEEMRAWLAQEPDCMSDEELWGEDKDKYTMADLERWLDLKNGVKGKVLKKGKKTEKIVEKGKGKEKEEAKEKIVGKGKEKEETKEKKKRVHRKKE